MASEVLHFLRKKTKGASGFLAAKLDLSKAYDRMEWGFVRATMAKLGFEEGWIDRVMRCMETVIYNFTLNGEPVSSLIPSRGLRQGDPISPYLFILGLEGLSTMLSKAENEKFIQGIKVCTRAPSVSHLFLLMILLFLREPLQKKLLIFSRFYLVSLLRQVSVLT